MTLLCGVLRLQHEGYRSYSLWTYINGPDAYKFGRTCRVYTYAFAVYANILHYICYTFYHFHTLLLICALEFVHITQSQVVYKITHFTTT